MTVAMGDTKARSSFAMRPPEKGGSKLERPQQPNKTLFEQEVT